MQSGPNLQLLPAHDTYFPILNAFQQGKPLSLQQLHFLRQHQAQLSNAKFDPLLRYYKTYPQNNSYLFPQQKFTPELLTHCKKRLQIALAAANHGIEIEFTLERFLEFKNVAAIDLLHLEPGKPFLQAGKPFLHPGMPFLHPGMPILPAGAPLLDYFQWENIFAVVRYEPYQAGVTGKVYLYFEELKEHLVPELLNEYLTRFQPQPPEPPAPTPIHEAPRLTYTLRTGPSFTPW